MNNFSTFIEKNKIKRYSSGDSNDTFKKKLILDRYITCIVQLLIISITNKTPGYDGSIFSFILFLFIIALFPYVSKN